MTTTERLARFETAQEVIGLMISDLSAKIGAERRSKEPDAAKIEALRTRLEVLATQEDELSLSDQLAIERVLSEYAPLVKAGAVQ